MSGATAFVDESHHDVGAVSVYAVAAVVVPEPAIDAARSAMAQQLSAGQGKVRWATESSARREQLLGAVAELPGLLLAAVDNGPRGSCERQRRQCLKELLLAMADTEGCRQMLLESRGPADDRRDFALIQGLRAAQHPGAGVRMDHLPGRKEPLLWAADILAGAITANERAAITDSARRLAVPDHTLRHVTC